MTLWTDEDTDLGSSSEWWLPRGVTAGIRVLRTRKCRLDCTMVDSAADARPCLQLVGETEEDMRLVVSSSWMIDRRRRTTMTREYGAVDGILKDVKYTTELVEKPPKAA